MAQIELQSYNIIFHCDSDRMMVHLYVLLIKTESILYFSAKRSFRCVETKMLYGIYMYRTVVIFRCEIIISVL